METGKRNIKDGQEFERFFIGKAKGDFITIKKAQADTFADTLPLMKKVVRDTLSDTTQIANYLKRNSVYETCQNIWDFCFTHFQYSKDEKHKEQIRRPLRSWQDRKAGIDCDCFTVFIGSVLTNLGIPFKMRLTYYKNQVDFSHIYPVVTTPNQEIIIDCVVHQFNYEAPYIVKKDEEMELQYLNGVGNLETDEIENNVSFDHDLPIDAEDLFLDGIELQGLEGKAERLARQKARQAERAARKKLPVKQRVKQGLKKGLNVINKVNPAAALLRAGILASLKLNIFKVSSKLRFAYWSAAEARKHNMDMGKFNQLQRIREKMEKIYYGAGGKTTALKKAILTGKGNRNKMVSLNGLGAIIPEVNDEDELRTILGEDLFFEELNGLEGLGSLGSAIATGTAVTAASGVMGTIAALIKKLGGLFKAGSAAAQKLKIQDNTDNAAERTRKFSIKNIINKVNSKVQERRSQKSASSTPLPTDSFELKKELVPPQTEDEFIPDEPIDLDLPEAESITEESNNDSEDDNEKDKPTGIKKWLAENKTLAIGLGTGILVGGTALTVYLVKKSNQKKGLSGAPKTTTTKTKKASGAKSKKVTAKKTKSSTKKKAKTSQAKAKPKTRKSRGITKVELI